LTHKIFNRKVEEVEEGKKKQTEYRVLLWAHRRCAATGLCGDKTMRCMVLWARVKSYTDVRFYAERPGPEPETWMLRVEGRAHALHSRLRRERYAPLLSLALARFYCVKAGKRQNSKFGLMQKYSSRQINTLQLTAVEEHNGV
jgi:hypothetical protein